MGSSSQHGSIDMVLVLVLVVGLLGVQPVKGWLPCASDANSSGRSASSPSSSSSLLSQQDSKR